tara:strand:- start:463 stop:564 length:102 start_codon:yes stop_codon:yes gene_type:complete
MNDRIRAEYPQTGIYSPILYRKRRGSQEEMGNF